MSNTSDKELLGMVESLYRSSPPFPRSTNHQTFLHFLPLVTRPPQQQKMRWIMVKLIYKCYFVWSHCKNLQLSVSSQRRCFELFLSSLSLPLAVALSSSSEQPRFRSPLYHTSSILNLRLFLQTLSHSQQWIVNNHSVVLALLSSKYIAFVLFFFTLL